jgi:hypothetical protein
VQFFDFTGSGPGGGDYSAGMGKHTGPVVAKGPIGLAGNSANPGLRDGRIVVPQNDGPIDWANVVLPQFCRFTSESQQGWFQPNALHNAFRPALLALAHRDFAESEMRFLAAALIWRLGLGCPRFPEEDGTLLPLPSSAAIAVLRESRCPFS